MACQYAASQYSWSSEDENSFSGRGRREKLLIIFIYGGFTPRSRPCFLSFSCSHPNAALMRIIRLFKNMHWEGSNCSHNLLWNLIHPEPPAKVLLFIKIIYLAVSKDVACSSAPSLPSIYTEVMEGIGLFSTASIDFGRHGRTSQKLLS